MRYIAPAILATLIATTAYGQSTPSTPAFEKADIHVALPSLSLGANRRVPSAGNGLFQIRNFSLLDMIAYAWGVDAEKVTGGPSWLEWDHFDINAAMSRDTSPEAQKLMLQKLLSDRFKLIVRNDTRDLPVYALTAGKTPKLKQAGGAGTVGCTSQPNMSAAALTNTWTCRNVTMEAFAQLLRPQVSQLSNGPLPVADQTELKGAWDFEYKVTVRRLASATADDENITIADAIEKQLGLKLTSVNVPMPVIAVESAVEKPTPNPPGVAESLAPQFAKQFEVADIKPSGPGARGLKAQITPGGGVNLEMPLLILISQAYGILSDDIISSPAVHDVLQTRYTIVAKPPSSGAAPAQASPVGAASLADTEAAWERMRTLLADRFGLVVHTEDRPLTAWKLVAVKPKLKKADPSQRTKTLNGPGADGKDPRKTTPVRSRLTTFQNVTMAQFAQALSGITEYVATPVVDATGLDGSYDITLSFSPVGLTRQVNAAPANGATDGGTPAAAAPDGAITLFEAIEDQLGLKLVQEKRPIPSFVIDRVSAKPTDN